MTLQIWPDLHLYGFLKYFRMRQPCVVNSNNKPWKWRECLDGLSPGPFRLGKRNRDFEEDLKKVVPEITKGELRESRKQLTQMSRFSEIPGIEDTDTINIRDSAHPLSDIKLYLQRGAVGALSQKTSEKLKEFHKLYSLGSLGYEGADVHDCGHLLTGFKPDNRGEAQQVVFDMYFQHMLRGLMANETLAISLQPNFKLAKLASQYMSLIADMNMMRKEMSNYSAMPSRHRGFYKPIINILDKEQKRTRNLYEDVANVFLNKWTFPDGHDGKLVDKSFRDIQSFLKRRELLVFSQKLPLAEDFQKHWLKDEEVEDITNYAQFCALKCMGHLSALSPEEKNKTIQQVMDENGYFNMKLLERSTGLETDNELKLPTYKKWQKMLDKQPDIDYNKLITKATQSIKAKS
jgi:hypothetical protein